ncbi:hypothetical protein DFJ74DRAFT_686608 [Hyaloraphidium curvatum]|nr:hypothetical protein DFJ74DRAFT_686608 [Hyaloraphidium curvatum]
MEAVEKLLHETELAKDGAMGPKPNPVCYDAAKLRASTLPTVLGQVVRFNLFHDVSREGLIVAELAGFQNQSGRMGRGPLEFELACLAADPSIPRLNPAERAAMTPGAFRDHVARSFGPMMDCWAASVVHEPTWASLLGASLVLGAVKPLHIHGYSAETTGAALGELLWRSWTVKEGMEQIEELFRGGALPHTLEDWEALVSPEDVAGVKWCPTPRSPACCAFSLPTLTPDPSSTTP